LNKILVAVIASAGFLACSSSNDPCQSNITPLNYGDCANLADAGSGSVIITPEQRTACATACSSSADQTALTNLLSCVNAIPGAVGACTTATESDWLNNVGTKSITCATTPANMPSTPCLAAISSTPDAG
jgi:hypothetical protein